MGIVVGLDWRSGIERRDDRREFWEYINLLTKRIARRVLEDTVSFSCE